MAISENADETQYSAKPGVNQVNPTQDPKWQNLDFMLMGAVIGKSKTNLNPYGVVLLDPGGEERVQSNQTPKRRWSC